MEEIIIGRKEKFVKNLKMALCFFDEEDNIVAKRDLNVSWKRENLKEESKVKNIIIMDAISNVISNEIKLDVDSAVRELLEEVGKEKP